MKLPYQASTVTDNCSNVEYDIVLCAIGYEQRATNVASKLALTENVVRLACAFREPQGLNFEENMAWFRANYFEIETVGDEEFNVWLDSCVLPRLLARGKRRVRVAIDISSLNRFRLACIVQFLSREDIHGNLETDFWYSVAEFSPPDAEEPPNKHVGPITPKFSGWFVEPDRPLAGIVGLGYEEGKALGAVEHLEIADIWCWLPQSPIGEYSEKVLSVNELLLSEVPDPRKLCYEVNQPAEVLTRLGTLATQLQGGFNVVVLPFGPKIFTLISLLVGLLNPTVAVWRVSPGVDLPPIDRVASEHLIGLRIHWSMTLQGGATQANLARDQRNLGVNS